MVETGDRLGATTNSPRSLHLPSLEGKERTRHRPPPTAQTPGKMQHPMPTGGGTGRGSQPRHGHVTGNGWAWMGLQRRHSSLCMHSPSSPNSRVLRVLPGCTATHAARQTLDRFGRTVVLISPLVCRPCPCRSSRDRLDPATNGGPRQDCNVNVSESLTSFGSLRQTDTQTVIKRFPGNGINQMWWPGAPRRGESPRVSPCDRGLLIPRLVVVLPRLSFCAVGCTPYLHCQWKAHRAVFTHILSSMMSSISP